jgi:hypothetical protein
MRFRTPHYQIKKDIRPKREDTIHTNYIGAPPPKKTFHFYFIDHLNYVT